MVEFILVFALTTLLQIAGTLATFWTADSGIPTTSFLEMALNVFWHQQFYGTAFISVLGTYLVFRAQALSHRLASRPVGKLKRLK